MSDNKISEFSGAKRTKREDAPPTPKVEAPPDPGGDQGTFERPPCGTCIHWKKQPTQGVGMGTCMMMPMTAIPVPGPDGRIQGIMNVRPGLRSIDEGCDQHEAEGEGDEEGDDGEPVNLLKSVGG